MGKGESRKDREAGRGKPCQEENLEQDFQDHREGTALGPDVPGLGILTTGLELTMQDFLITEFRMDGKMRGA